MNNLTKGTAVLNHLFDSYKPYCGPISRSNRGDIVSVADGVASGYALESIESRGTLFISPGTNVYAGLFLFTFFISFLF